METFLMRMFFLIIMMSLVFLSSCTGIIADKWRFLDFSVSVNEGLTGNVTILARKYVTNTVHIVGGHYTTSYVISAPNTEYILDGDITADGTAISINASKVVLNLNGHTIIYNQIIPGEGVNLLDYNKTDIAITNGSIIQGAAMSEGALYGEGNNPIRTSPYSVPRTQITDIYARYGGKDVAGFYLKGSNSIIEYNTVEDTYEYGTLKDRHSGTSAVRISGDRAIVRDNTLINSRHRGIEIGHYAEVYGNTIGIRSIATNAVGISGWAVHDVKVYNNNITGRGEHPIGIGFSGPPTTNIEIYNNIIDVQVTQLGCEYGGNLSNCAEHVGSCWTSGIPCVTDRGTGIRAHKEGHNVYVHDNTVTVRTDAAYSGTYSPTGESVMIQSKGRGIQVGNPADGSALYENNTVYAMDKDGSYGSDGTMPIGGIVCDTNYAGSNLVVKGNTVTSNLAPLVLGDGYGWCQGHPLFIQNTFIKSTEYSATPNYPAHFHTISAGLGGYYEVTGTLISNVYQNGASESDLQMYFNNVTNYNAQNDTGSVKNKSIIFGRLMEGTVKDTAATLQPNTRVRTYDQTNALQTEAITDANGVAQFMVYDYELDNAGGTTGNATPITVAYRPHTIELYNLTSSQALFTTSPDSSGEAWDALASSRTHTLSDLNGSIAINTLAGMFVPPIVTTLPTVSITSPSSASTLSGSVPVTVNTSGVSKVEYYLNNSLQSTISAFPYSYNWNTTTVSNGPYTLSAKAYDAAGNVGTTTNVSVTVNNPNPDSTPPTVSMSSPVNNVTISGTVSVSINASDAVGVSKVEFYEDGVMNAVMNIAPYNYNLNTTLTSNGSHKLSAKAYDAVGNVGQSADVTVTINNPVPDTTAPIVTAFTFPATATSLTMAISSFTASDNVGVTGYLVTESSSAPSAIAAGWSASSPTSFTFSSAGVKSVYVWAKDAAGNVSASRLATVTITLPDTTPPTVNSFSMPATATIFSVLVSSFPASDNMAVTGYKITESSAAPAATATGWSATAPVSFTFAGSGARTAYAWAKDAAGNVSTAVRANVTITLTDVTAPSVAITSPASGATANGLLTINISASDNIGVTRVELYLNGTLLATDTVTPYNFSWNTAGYANGTYTLIAKAYDAAGNLGQSASVSAVINNIVTSPIVLAGDVNGDGLVTVRDALTVLRAALDIALQTQAIKIAGDVWPLNSSGKPQGDGVVDINDARLILQNAVGAVTW